MSCLLLKQMNIMYRNAVCMYIFLFKFVCRKIDEHLNLNQLPMDVYLEHQ